jgi:hypothetical protein
LVLPLLGDDDVLTAAHRRALQEITRLREQQQQKSAALAKGSDAAVADVFPDLALVPESLDVVTCQAPVAPPADDDMQLLPSDSLDVLVPVKPAATAAARRGGRARAVMLSDDDDD